MADESKKEETGKKKYNVQNLIPLTERTPEERHAITSKGGKNSVKKRRLARDMRESMKVLLDMTVTKSKLREVLGDNADIFPDDIEITYADLLNMKMMMVATEGSAKHFEVARDTAGYKPIDQVQTDINIMSPEDKKLLDKLAKREGVKTETD